jgi:hypothetical protein
MIRNRLPPSKPIIENHRAITSTTQENTNANTPRQCGKSLGASYSQRVRNNQTPTIIVPNNTQENTLAKIMRDSFMLFEAILTKQAE